MGSFIRFDDDIILCGELSCIWLDMMTEGRYCRRRVTCQHYYYY